MMGKIFIFIILEFLRAAVTPEERRAAERIISEAYNYQIGFCARPNEYRNPSLDSGIKLIHPRFKGISFPFYVKIGDDISRALEQTGNWENNLIDKFVEFLERYRISHNITKKNELLILDIGANIGWYTIILGKLGYSVMAFEPLPTNQYILRKNLCINSDIELVIIPYGLGEEEKTCILYTTGRHSLNGVLDCVNLNRNHPCYVTDVKTVRLEPFLEFIPNVVAIKMDVEGFEYKVARGARDLFFNKKVPYFQMEFCRDHFEKQGSNSTEFMGELYRSGYKIYRGTSNTQISFREITDLSRNRNFWCDLRLEA